MRMKDWFAVISTLALCVFGLAACGGGGSSSTPSGDGGSEEEAALAFTECMRLHGVEVEDPKPGQKNIEIPDTGDPTSKKALVACNGKLGDAGQELSPEEGNEFREGWLAFTQCMRGQGVDLADPKFQGPGKVLLGIAGVDTSSPAFKAAREACQGKAPQTSGFGVGG